MTIITKAGEPIMNDLTEVSLGASLHIQPQAQQQTAGGANA